MFSFYWEKCNFEHSGNSMHTSEFLALGEVPNIYIDCLMFYPSRQHMNWKHLKYRFTFNNDFMMKRRYIYVNFNVFCVIRNDFGHEHICWWATLLVRASQWGQVVEINFSSIINFASCWKLFLSLPVGSCIMKMHSWYITILGYAAHSRKFKNS